MEKRKIALIFLLLSGCSKQRSIACSRFDNEDSLTLYLYGENDVLKMAEVEEVFVFPAKALADKTFSKDLLKQLENCDRMEGNKLFRRYSLVIDDIYSYSRTIEELERKRYHCE